MPHTTPTLRHHSEHIAAGESYFGVWSLISLVKYCVTPCTLEQWCKAYNQPKAASLRSVGSPFDIGSCTWKTDNSSGGIITGLRGRRRGLDDRVTVRATTPWMCGRLHRARAKRASIHRIIVPVNVFGFFPWFRFRLDHQFLEVPAWSSGRKAVSWHSRQRENRPLRTGLSRLFPSISYV